MQRDAAELIEFWRNKFNIQLPHKDFDLYEIEGAVYHYSIKDIIRVANKLSESNISTIIDMLRKRPGCVVIDWTDKLKSLYNWIMTYFCLRQLDWNEFDAMLRMGLVHDVNLICGTAQKLIDEGKPLSIHYLKKVIESTAEQENSKQQIEQQMINSRRIDTGSIKKESIDGEDIINTYKDLVDEI